MRKTLLVASASIFGICVLVIAAKAATTWQGPPINCTSPEGLNCNTNGVIWNQTTQQSPANFNVSGNGQTGGSLTAGTGLIVNSGGANITGSTRIINSDTRITNGDLYFETDSKAIHIDQAGTAHLLIGNWTAVPNTSNVEVTIFGDLKVDVQAGKAYAPKMTTPTLCLNGDCRSAWPAVGGGGDITGVTASTGLSGGGMNGDVTLSIDTAYTDGRYVNTAGDTMTGQLTIDRADATWPSISAVNGIQSNSFVQFYNQLSINSPGIGVYAAAPTAGSFAGTAYGVVAYAQPGGAAGYFANAPSGFPVTKRVELATQNNAVEAILGNIKVNAGNSICFEADCRNSWSSVSGITGATTNGGLVVNGTTLGMQTTCAAGQLLKWNGAAWICAGDLNSGDVTDVLAGTGVTVTNPAGPQPTVSLPIGYQLPQACAMNQISKWNGASWVCAADATGGTGDITDVLAGTGVTVTNPAGPQPTINVVDNYVNTTGDSLTGDLNILTNKFNFGATYRQMMDFYGSAYGIGVQSTVEYFRSGGGFAWYKNGTHSNTAYDQGAGGTKNMTLDGNGGLQVFGPVNGYYFNNRTASTQWALYSDNLAPYSGGVAVNAMALWSGSNKLIVDTNGYLTVVGGCVRNWAGTTISGTCPSDAKLKKNILPLSGILEKFSQLQPVSFNWKETGTKDYGLVAQEVERIFPSLVETDKDGTKKVHYDARLQVFTIEAIKELKIQNDMLQAENDMLLHRIEAIEAKLK